MARRGFFGRVADAARRAAHAVFPVIPKKPRRPPEPPPEPPREPPKRRKPGITSPRDLYRQIWIEERLQRPGRSYAKHLELFMSLPGMIDEELPERLEFWRMYAQYMVKGIHRRNDRANPFWSATGLHPGDFDWDEFRTAMGYKKRARAA
jgi:hypothetical protein